ncbi:uncharacterized protein LOC126191205 [Schistocerca cancellata]|uniref:uncharacterized protein LOC126191205 n=1 Tax=Schistocerca cancellata TaxID=274614 RepID=UPI0021197DEF|nr:uncharacterized protein LOC126191205 [Schistocerca cancellata]
MLGPLLFLIYINDMTSSITSNSKIFLFADVTSLVVKDVGCLACDGRRKTNNNVRERPMLWDQKNKLYHNRDFIRQAWNEIAEDCGTDSEVMKNKWKNQCDTFRSELKKTRAERSGDEGGMLPFQSN